MSTGGPTGFEFSGTARGSWGAVSTASGVSAVSAVVQPGCDLALHRSCLSKHTAASTAAQNPGAANLPLAQFIPNDPPSGVCSATWKVLFSCDPQIELVAR